MPSFISASVGHNESRSTIGVGSGKDDVNFFQRSASCLWVEEVYDRNVNEVDDGKEQVASPFGLVDENWSEHHHGKVANPIGTRGDGGGHGSSSQCIDFWWVHPCSTNQEQWSSSESVNQKEGWNGKDSVDNGEDTTHDEGLSSGKIQGVLKQDSGVINRCVTASELLEELGTGSQHHSSEVLMLSPTEKLFESELGVIESVNSVCNHGRLGNDTVPSWRLWQTGHKQKQPQSKHDLQSNWQSPRNRTVCVRQTKVDPIGNQSTDSDDRTFKIDQTTSILWFRVLGLPHRNGGRVHTVTDTSDRSSNDEVAQLPVRLEWENRHDGTNDNDKGAEHDHVTSSQTLTPNHSKQSTKETSNLVTSSHNTLDDSSVSGGTTDGRELLLELWGSDDTTHKALVIAKQAETHHRGESDSPSELSATQTKCIVFISEAIIPNSQVGLFVVVCG
ncbi:hypothetical protein OGATHE_004250 [Ogataea polymorpha]|uniref:Uncharacterized protein n=1 Tax=Ogataea polymorpha TaxID=460523 RepID=A0A9P8T275_9ASCO|nr:hypothetical protein OGATHE_004250 [Ogataea polymorpha]